MLSHVEFRRAASTAFDTQKTNIIMGNSCFNSPLTTDETKNDYVDKFQLTRDYDPRPPGCGYRTWPAVWFVPSKWEQRNAGQNCYRYVGAFWLRRQLKKENSCCSCYPRPLQGTNRNTLERERALILTVALTIKYELGHLWGGILHFSTVTILLLLALLGVGNDYAIDFYIIPVAQYILIYFLHILPCCVQRLNRAQLYSAIAEFRSTQVNDTTTA